jgi:hypothetical protein
MSAGLPLWFNFGFRDELCDLCILCALFGFLAWIQNGFWDSGFKQNMPSVTEGMSFRKSNGNQILGYFTRM